MKIIKILIAVLFSLLLTAYAAFWVGADAMPENEIPDDVIITAARPDAVLDADAVKTPYAILIEQTTGTVIFEKNADERIAPASVTKIMSMLLIMEALERGEIQLEDQVACSEHASSMGGSQIWLEVGEVMSVNDLLKAVAVGSANDATVALAEFLAGSEDAFVRMMNERASELGMTNTNYMNASGLDEDDHYTSARDTAIAASELIQHTLIINYSTIWMDTLRDGATELVNTNKLVRFYKGITGLKTGTTDKAGSCLTATAERDGLKLVASVFGSTTSDERFSAARTLLDFGYANYVILTPEAPSEEIILSVKRGTLSKVEIYAGEIPNILLKKGSDKNLIYITEIPEQLTAPIAQGEAVGRVVITTQSGEQVGEYPLVAKQSVDRLTFWKAFVMLLKNYTSMGS
ncbi:MAG TPA: D-alanyl-D-alanine carboxypeptidase family protein [Oscillospiraceae bacterium]|nr:D-alanyl-D-alanine carboxypeptidase family protein [Oscillospiraceae bacterium]HPF55463.1 D-alanyl-D-alanine carboxypeptidase family protein [Clostridiales bacterium]HPK34297.1 D-alanyl-D-alanine carboxypeptidase family protein [Oscillospiraceae bacterium]HPR74800.1 D-alanyl-D-alanine carboxypeptidase family protein [Oscillospiraceae bacterium]